MELQEPAVLPPRRNRPILIAIGIVIVVAMMLVPVIGASRAQAAAAKCMANLPTLSKAIHMYMADNDGHVPPFNTGFIDLWETTAGRLPAYRYVNPLAKYGNFMDLERCPGNDHWYTTRFAFYFSRKDAMYHARPDEARLVDPQPETVLAVCNQHLDSGMATKLFSTASSYSMSIDKRSGFHQVLRGDGSAGRVDSQSVRQFRYDAASGDVRWVDCTPYFKHLGEGMGMPIDVFPNEPWPPRWALRFKP